MGKRIGFGIVLTVVLANLCIMGQAAASDTVGSFDWELWNVVDMGGNPVQLHQSVLSLDVDLGFDFLNLYGKLCSEDRFDCTPVNGGGYFHNDASGQTIEIDIRAGKELYRISISNTLDGTFAIYNQNGQIEYSGYIDFLYSY